MPDQLPALLGGPPSCPAGPPTWPIPDDDVLQALQSAYADGSWGKYHGGAVERLEAALAEYHGVEFAIACASGTFAVDLALRALKVGPGDEVIEAGYDYGGNFLSIHAMGALPVFVDLDRNNWNFDPARLEEAIGSPPSGKLRAILVSHLHGGMVPMPTVMEIADRHNLPVIEDAAQVAGATAAGRKAGTWGDVGIHSFGGSKLLTAGRGGALLTNRADVHQRIRTMYHRGNLVAPLSELQAAVLLPQLAKLDARNAIRSENVAVLFERLHGVPGLVPFVNNVEEVAQTRPAYFKVGFQYDAARFGLPRNRFLAAVRAEGVAMDEGFRSLHVGRAPSRFRAAGSLAEADRAHSGTVVLHHPVLLGPRSGIEEVAQAVAKVHANVERLAKP
jgi:dTDP-4-amino-4,6-dideoxygalactose transaminase